MKAKGALLAAFSAAASLAVSAYLWLGLLWFGGITVTAFGLRALVGEGCDFVFAGLALMATGAFVLRGMSSE